jgi:hypothetical protein
MDMSAAALPPRSGIVTEVERKDPLYLKFQQYQASCRKNLIDCPDFADWKAAEQRQAELAEISRHPQFPAFQQWMRDTQGGARKCPAGSFPENFFYWLDGKRW